MKKRTRIIQISGLRGILMMLFIVSCLAAGFIAFPAFVPMYAWNWSTQYFAIPAINIYQGLMLWAIVAISGFIINDRKKFLVAFKTPDLPPITSLKVLFSCPAYPLTVPTRL